MFNYNRLKPRLLQNGVKAVLPFFRIPASEYQLCDNAGARLCSVFCVIINVLNVVWCVKSIYIIDLYFKKV